ncbi:hypothetical protein AB0H57_32570 [Micromonospora sp. NPDC050686]|uniref:immunity protein Imm33 domain-containing protein n=1 Tax=Micromonospora sp. NPDC050686 TaxID=3154631 RepID=UPI0033F81B4F
MPDLVDEIGWNAGNQAVGPFALALPVNALRHPLWKRSSGWYIWSGEDFPEVFEPQHVVHVVELLPEIEPYLDLPPGWRFLLAPGCEDVWQDDSLFDV